MQPLNPFVLDIVERIKFIESRPYRAMHKLFLITEVIDYIKLNSDAGLNDNDWYILGAVINRFYRRLD